MGSRFRPAIDVKTVLDRYQGVVTDVVTGGSTGADAAARAWASDNGVNCIVMEPEWSRDGVDAITIRNDRMVDNGAELCLAFPMHDSTGTRDLVSKAGSHGIPTTVIRPAVENKRPIEQGSVVVMPQDGQLLAMTSKHLSAKYANALSRIRRMQPQGAELDDHA